MKTIFFTAAILFSLTGFSQSYHTVQKLNKKCSVVSNDDGLYGLVYNSKLVQGFKFEEYDVWAGFINFFSDSASVCWNDTGKKLLEFNDARITIGEGDDFLFVDKGGQTSLYSADGRQVLPYGKYEFEFFQNGILVHNEAQQQAFFNEFGREVFPFGNHEISVVDDYEDVLALVKDGRTTVLLNDRISPPSSFSKLNDFTFVSNHEVTVQEYLYFLGSQQYSGYLYDENAGLVLPASSYFPDTSKVEAKLLPLYRRLFKILSAAEWEIEYDTYVFMPEKSKMYLTFELSKQEKILGQFPVTGITKEQAEAYCKWLSIYSAEHTDYYDSFDSSVEYRLPSSNEWQEMAAESVESQSRTMPDSLSSENCMMFIYDNKVQCKNYASYLKKSLGGGAIPSDSAPYDSEGRSHIFGNVAEMTAEEGVAKGGSYAHPAAKASLKHTIEYSEPQPWLGFRIVGEYHY